MKSFGARTDAVLHADGIVEDEMKKFLIAVGAMLAVSLFPGGAFAFSEVGVAGVHTPSAVVKVGCRHYRRACAPVVRYRVCSGCGSCCRPCGYYCGWYSAYGSGACGCGWGGCGPDGVYYGGHWFGGVPLFGWLF